MNIGIIGAGNIGGTLGTKWALAEHQVYFGVRNPDKPALVEQMSSVKGNVRLGTSGEAISASDLIVLAVPGAAVAQVIADNVEALDGKIIIDSLNNMRGEARHALHYLRETTAATKRSLLRLVISHSCLMIESS